LYFTSCQKKNKEVDNDTQSVVDNAICEQEFMQIQPTVNSKAISTKGTGAVNKISSGSSCDTLHLISGDTLWTSANHIAPVYQFDLGNCSNVNGDGIGKNRNHYCKINWKNKNPGSQMIINLNAYKLNDPTGAVNYSCTNITVKTISVVTSSLSAMPVSYTFSVDVNNAVCSGTGWSISYDSHKTVKTDNQGTAVADDDITTILSGTSSGVNRNGRAFAVNINNLIKPASCRHITAGTLELTPDGFKNPYS